jgi:hypothetical protein
MSIELPTPESSFFPEIPATNELKDPDKLRRFLQSLKQALESSNMGLFNNDRAIADVAGGFSTTGTTGCLLLTGDQTAAGTKTFSVIPLVVAQPSSATQLANKTYADAVSITAASSQIAVTLGTSTGHRHDGTESRKVLATSLDMSGISSGHILYNSGGTLAGMASANPYAAGTYREAYDAGSGTTDSYVKVGEVQIFRDGTLTLHTTVAGSRSDGSDRSYAKIYKNSSAVGVELVGVSNIQSSTSENIAGWVTGDLVQLWAKVDSGDGGAYTADAAMTIRCSAPSAPYNTP